jgi:tRNA N(3)-methylcytidine methyltransferase METTL6
VTVNDKSDNNTTVTWSNIAKQERKGGIDHHETYCPVDDTDRETLDTMLARQDNMLVPDDYKHKIETKASRFWDKFYMRNENRFFKNRYYLRKIYDGVLPGPEFTAEQWLNESEANKKVFLEVGSGVGNSVMPLMESCPHLHFYASDFAPNAVKILEQSVDSKRCDAFVFDLVQDTWPAWMRAPHFANLLFVLSAIAPEHHTNVLRKMYTVMAPGGLLYFRDYARYDMSHIRFKPGSKIRDNYYVRRDGTCSYFFTIEEMEKKFTEAGFEIVKNVYHRKFIENKKLKLQMKRVWCFAIVRKPASAVPSVHIPAGATAAGME